MRYAAEMGPHHRVAAPGIQGLMRGGVELDEVDPLGQPLVSQVLVGAGWVVAAACEGFGRHDGLAVDVRRLVFINQVEPDLVLPSIHPRAGVHDELGELVLRRWFRGRSWAGRSKDESMPEQKTGRSVKIGFLLDSFPAHAAGGFEPGAARGGRDREQGDGNQGVRSWGGKSIDICIQSPILNGAGKSDFEPRNIEFQMSNIEVHTVRGLHLPI